ncbi:hypothetical protein HKD37_19G054603 [Glycine soja]
MTSITHKETNLKSKTQDDESMIMTCENKTSEVRVAHLMVIYCRNSDLSSQTPQICSKATYNTATVPPVAGSSSCSQPTTHSDSHQHCINNLALASKTTTHGTTVCWIVVKEHHHRLLETISNDGLRWLAANEGRANLDAIGEILTSP